MAGSELKIDILKAEDFGFEELEVAYGVPPILTFANVDTTDRLQDVSADLSEFEELHLGALETVPLAVDSSALNMERVADGVDLSNEVRLADLLDLNTIEDHPPDVLKDMVFGELDDRVC